MPKGNTFRAKDGTGDASRLKLEAGTNQSIYVNRANTVLIPAASGITINTIDCPLSGQIRLTNDSSDSVTLVDNTGNLELNGANVVLTTGRSAILEKKITGSTTEWLIAGTVGK